MVFVCAVGVPAQPLHPVRAATQDPPVHVHPARAAARHVRLRVLSHRVPQDAVSRHPAAAAAHQVSRNYEYFHTIKLWQF